VTTGDILLTEYPYNNQKTMETSNPDSISLVPLEVQFALAKQYAMVDSCNDRDKLKELLKDVLRQNAVQHVYYKDLLKKHWGIN
jgi:hypothetical protein